MTEEQVKFYFNQVYRHILEAPRSFGELVDYASRRKLDDDMFMTMLDTLESSGIVKLSGETYSVALERV